MQDTKTCARCGSSRLINRNNRYICSDCATWQNEINNNDNIDKQKKNNIELHNDEVICLTMQDYIKELIKERDSIYDDDTKKERLLQLEGMIFLVEKIIEKTKTIYNTTN